MTYPTPEVPTNYPINVVPSANDRISLIKELSGPNPWIPGAAFTRLPWLRDYLIQALSREHCPGVKPKVKFDTPEGLFTPICSCGWESKSYGSRAQAQESGRQHARDSGLTPKVRRTDCPKCKRKTVVPSKGGGEVCMANDCDYWFCY